MTAFNQLLELSFVAFLLQVIILEITFSKSNPVTLFFCPTVRSAQNPREYSSSVWSACPIKAEEKHDSVQYAC